MSLLWQGKINECVTTDWVVEIILFLITVLQDIWWNVNTSSWSMSPYSLWGPWYLKLRIIFGIRRTCYSASIWTFTIQNFKTGILDLTTYFLFSCLWFFMLSNGLSWLSHTFFCQFLCQGKSLQPSMEFIPPGYSGCMSWSISISATVFQDKNIQFWYRVPCFDYNISLWLRLDGLQNNRYLLFQWDVLLHSSL